LPQERSNRVSNQFLVICQQYSHFILNSETVL